MAWTEQLTLWSRLHLGLWRRLRLKRDFSGRLRAGLTLHLRPQPATDTQLAERVFGEEVFRPPHPLDGTPRLVDTSAGAGLTVLYWVWKHPDAAVIAFEAHPDRVDAFVENTERNALWDRVLLHPHQAGASEGEANLDHENEEGFAFLFKKGGASRLHGVKRVDFFERVGTQPISVLKLRIEGEGQPILADARFAGLSVDQVVIEGGTPASRAWCEQRLSELGYRTEPASSEALLWATKA